MQAITFQPENYNVIGTHDLCDTSVVFYQLSRVALIFWQPLLQWQDIRNQNCPVPYSSRLHSSSFNDISNRFQCFPRVSFRTLTSFAVALISVIASTNKRAFGVLAVCFSGTVMRISHTFIYIQKHNGYFKQKKMVAFAMETEDFRQLYIVYPQTREGFY